MKNYADHQTQIDQFLAAADFEFVAIALIEPAENQYVLKWKYTSGSISNRIKKMLLQSGKGIAGMVFKTGKPLLVKDRTDFVQNGDLFNFPILVFENLRSFGAVPLWHNGRVAGVLLGGFRVEGLMTEEKMELLIQKASSGFGNLDGKDLIFR